ncbi:helix-turn-helix domain-containing protein [Winogradskyella ouciana]|uniref:Helix-turn-helix domain-containing protein n=1 Tax=Winogradskyella ouciana TaxID=2608631 RepID=A0A7K1G9I8_9FLAO|nr:AraC family transcriptional regulator [Winogradskyella ouciana]MTE25940.1 helix-turn-helix domain-containing protein [Winogradskyella ouciana]
MKTIDITAQDTASLFNKLKAEIGGTVEVKLKEYILRFNNSLGKGMVRGMQIPNNITFLQVDAKFYENLSFNVESPKNAIINFLYCNEGNLSYSFGPNKSKTELKTFQTGISTNINSSENTIYFSKDNRVESVLISVNTIGKEKLDCSINKTLKEAFIDNKTEDFLYLSSYNLKITNHIKQLNAIEQEGVVRTLLIEGLVNTVLALEVEQHKLDCKNSESAIGNLTQYELKQIKELTNYINEHPETNFGVNECCAKIGLSPAKVQDGFKSMHGKTLNEYIRYVRVKKSEELIKNTDLNISEIVYTLGLSSRSYFSRIFKDTYNCTPSKYKKHQKLAAIA